MMFSFVIFYWGAKDGHSKHEGLEIFNMNLKKCFFPISFLKPAINWPTVYDF